jgi:DNA-directed RNA polymerase specialized sigma24 family protein
MVLWVAANVWAERLAAILHVKPRVGGSQWGKWVAGPRWEKGDQANTESEPITAGFMDMPTDTAIVAREFPPTDWKLVKAAGESSMAGQRMALEKVLVCYLPVLRTYLMSRFRVSEDRASDWLQSFVLQKVLEKDLIGQADARRGKFRTFLVSALNNFVIQQIRYDRSSLRCCPGEVVPLEEMPESAPSAIQGREAETFDIAWARGVLAEALDRMKSYCAASGQAEVWAVFESRLVNPLLDGVEPPSYEQLVTTYGLQSPSQASNLLVTAKRVFGRLVRSVIGEYAGDELAIEREIQDLKAVLYQGSTTNPFLAKSA